MLLPFFRFYKRLKSHNLGFPYDIVVQVTDFKVNTHVMEQTVATGEKRMIKPDRKLFQHVFFPKDLGKPFNGLGLFGT